MLFLAQPGDIPSPALFLQQVLSESHDKTTYFYCYENRFAPCDGCNSCQKSGICRHRDLDPFYQNFLTADRIVYAFPVYNGSLPAPMKALVDRLQPFYYLHFSGQDPFAEKRPVTVVMTAGAKNFQPKPVLAQLRPVFSVTGCQFEKCFALTGTDSPTPNFTTISGKDEL